MKKVSLIILNWNGWQMTLACLKSLCLVQTNSFILEILIVDNGSTDESLDKINNWILENSRDLRSIEFKIIKNKINLGFAQGNNVGIKESLKNKADFVCLLNNDTRVGPNFLKELVKVLETDEKAGMAGGKIYFEKGYEFHKDRYKKEELGKAIWYAGGVIDWNNVYTTHRGVDEVDLGQYNQVTETDFVNGCLCLIKKEVFEKIGFFDPRYYLYFEDADLSMRAKKAGFKLLFCPNSQIWHLNSGSSGSGSGLHDYFTTRNRMLFGMKFAPIRSKLALVKESFRLLRTGRIWQKKGILDFYFGRFGKGSWNG